MAIYINTNELIQNALVKGYNVTNEDLLYAFVYNVIGNKTQAYQITHDCTKITEEKMRQSVAYYTRTPKIEYLCTIMKPIVSNTVRDYFTTNSAEFMDLIDSKSKGTIEMNAFNIDLIGDVEHLTEEEIRKYATICIRNSSNLLNSGDPDKMLKIVNLLSAYLRQFVEKKDDEQTTVVVVPQKYQHICPHCNKEF